MPVIVCDSYLSHFSSYVLLCLSRSHNTWHVVDGNGAMLVAGFGIRPAHLGLLTRHRLPGRLCEALLFGRFAGFGRLCFWLAWYEGGAEADCVQLPCVPLVYVIFNVVSIISYKKR